MNLYELRIGNLVYPINRAAEVHLPIETPLKVLQVGPFRTKAIPYNKHYTSMEWPDHRLTDLSPIDISKEWLERSGFKLTPEGHYWIKHMGMFKIRFSTDDLSASLESIGINIRYVHELQNLYYTLMKEELEIVP